MNDKKIFLGGGETREGEKPGVIQARRRAVPAEEDATEFYPN